MKESENQPQVYGATSTSEVNVTPIQQGAQSASPRKLGLGDGLPLRVETKSETTANKVAVHIVHPQQLGELITKRIIETLRDVGMTIPNLRSNAGAIPTEAATVEPTRIDGSFQLDEVSGELRVRAGE